MSIPAAWTGTGPGPSRPLNFVSGQARHYTLPCRVLPAHGLWRGPKHGPAGLFCIGLAHLARALTGSRVSPQPAEAVTTRGQEQKWREAGSGASSARRRSARLL
jgi:hypothetical protein